MSYLKEFIIGSSYLVFLPFFYAVKNSVNKNYSYYYYTMAAPFGFGLWNIISLLIAEHFGLSKRQRFLVISIISSLTIMTISFYSKSYNFTREEWKTYFLNISVRYLIIWNIVIYYLDKYI